MASTSESIESSNMKSWTWSWASTLGPIQFLDIGNRLVPLCELKEVKCSLYQSGPTGELRSGHLLLRGYLISTSIKYRPLAKQGSKAPFEVYQLDIMQRRVGNVWADYDSSLPGIDHVASGTLVKCFTVTTRLDSGSLTLPLLNEVGYDE